MSRQLKFRGKREDNVEWVHGFYVELYNAKGRKSHRIYSGYSETDVDDWFPDPFEVDSETVGQYTGMKDENGVEIYEGDVVEAWSQGIKGRGEIKQRNDGLWIFYPAWQSKRFWGLMPSIDGIADVKVIGNIHDNLELLEETK